MHLLMFDLDGTLMKSNTLDVYCFTEAVKGVTGIEKIESDWSHYKHVTDKGIISQIVSKAFGRSVTEDELMSIRTKIRRILQREIAANGWKFSAIPGAVELLGRLAKIKACGVAIATGSWKELAYLKLSAAGFDAATLPLASSDDSHRREEIMTAAFQRAKGFYGVHEFDTVTYIGDGMWDLGASKKMGYHFIGIGSNDTRVPMIKEGALHVFSDFSDQEGFIAEMDKIWTA
jgi:phosphoglycolate phosphatase-like HAD superfamily hydrolase